MTNLQTQYNRTRSTSPFEGEWAKAPYSTAVPHSTKEEPTQYVHVSTDIVCGACGGPAYKHPFTKAGCYRDPFDWTLDSGDYQSFTDDEDDLPLITTDFIIARNQHLTTIKRDGTYIFVYVDETGPTPVPYFRYQPRGAKPTETTADYSSLDGLPVVDYSGPGIMDRSSEYLDDYDAESSLDSWTDKAPPTWVPPVTYKAPFDSEGNELTQHHKYYHKPDGTAVPYSEVTFKEVTKPGYWTGGEFTSAINWWYCTGDVDSRHATYDSGKYSPEHYQYKGSFPSADDVLNEKRTVFVENNDAFFAERIIDLGVTERYANRLLNMYVHKKSGKFHCGSVSIEASSEGTIVATCISPLCYGKQANGDYARNTLAIPIPSELKHYSEDLPTEVRTPLEEFVYAIIAHGNNHGPDWLTKRPDYYTLHPQLPPVEVTEDYDPLDTVWEHARYCTQPTCKCSDVLFPNTQPTTKNQEIAA